MILADWTGLDDPEVGSDPTLEDKDLQVPPEDAQRRISPNSELPDKEQVVEASREETENDAGEQGEFFRLARPQFSCTVTENNAVLQKPTC